jgi:hypothetical protein
VDRDEALGFPRQRTGGGCRRARDTQATAAFSHIKGITVEYAVAVDA